MTHPWLPESLSISRLFAGDKQVKVPTVTASTTAVDPAITAIEESVVSIVRVATLPRVQERFVAQSGVALERAAYGVLRELEEDRPVRLTELANRIGLDLSTVSRQVKALESASLVVRSEDPVDRRAAGVRLSDSGAEALGRLQQVRHRFFAEVLADWPAEDRNRLAPLLERLAREVRELGGRL
jgi:DNA-binding MarR family transcriptional regulator